ncbi:PH domain-containing protein [Rathayibacter festucae]|uniref:PH domain-containing protein n=1 Tax=Rathayibacter festucae TaxID=110937 RepID=UPI002A6B822B|nr:PH domain-containing protein [Rathayibacter festucae]MDY0914656.1 PH domain-containing protein [Rathayibacter festucae]
MTPDGRRLPLRSIGATYLSELPSSAGLLLAAVVSGAEQSTGLGLWLRPALFVLLSVRLLHPVHTWLCVVVVIESDGLQVRSGLLFRRVRTVTWRDVVSVDARSTWSDRLLGLQRVSVASAGESAVVLPGLDTSRAEEIAELGRASGIRKEARPPSGSSGSRAARPTIGRRPSPLSRRSPLDRVEVLYRSSAADLLLAGLTQGKLFVLAAVCASTVLNAMNELGLLPLLASSFREAPAVASAALVLTSALIGCGVMMVRFHAFEVLKRDGGLVIRFGLVGRREREVLASSIIGVRLRRNVIEMALDRVRVDVLSTDSAGRSTSSVLLPSLPRAGLPTVLVQSLGADCSSTMLSTDGRRSLARALVASIVIASPSVLCLLASSVVPPWFPLLLAVSAFLTTLALARLISARLRLDDCFLIRRVRAAVDEDEVVVASALHQVAAVALAGACPLRLIRAHYLAGRPRALTALTRSSCIDTRLSSEVFSAAPGIAARRRRRGL